MRGQEQLAFASKIDLTYLGGIGTRPAETQSHGDGADCGGTWRGAAKAAERLSYLSLPRLRRAITDRRGPWRPILIDNVARIAKGLKVEP